MMKRQKRKLGDFCTLNYGKGLKKDNRKGGDVPVFGSNGIVGYHDKPQVTEPTIIIGRKGSVGEVHLTEVPSWPIDTTYYVDFDSEEIDIKWLYYQLKHLPLARLNRAAAVPGINRDKVYALEIFVPSLQDQRRIARLLSYCETLIQKRKESIELLDEFLKATFLEMFGDPALNTYSFPLMTGEEFCEKLTVGVVVKPASHYVDTGVVALRSLNVKPNSFDLSDLVYFSNEANHTILSKSRLEKGDVVIVRTGKTGTAAVISDELDGTNCIDLIIVRTNKVVVNPLYLTFLLNSERGKSIILGKEVGGIHKHFNVSAMKSLSIPIPPLEVQSRFAQIVQHTEALKTKFNESLQELENLYGSLSQKAFKGELDLSKMVKLEIKEMLNSAEWLKKQQDMFKPFAKMAESMKGALEIHKTVKKVVDPMLQVSKAMQKLSFPVPQQLLELQTKLEHMGLENLSDISTLEQYKAVITLPVFQHDDLAEVAKLEGLEHLHAAYVEALEEEQVAERQQLLDNNLDRLKTARSTGEEHQNRLAAIGASLATVKSGFTGQGEFNEMYARGAVLDSLGSEFSFAQFWEQVEQLDTETPVTYEFVRSLFLKWVTGATPVLQQVFDEETNTVKFRRGNETAQA